MKKMIPVKIKRIIKEGYYDWKNFGFKVMIARAYCTFSDESIKGIRFKNKYILQYLEKEYSHVIGRYRNIGDELVETNEIKKAPIWILWWDGYDNMPSVIKGCHESKIIHAGENPVILLDKNNIGQYVEFPEYVWEQFRSGKLRIQHLADMIRVQLIKKYGGLWLDASIFCAQNIPEEFWNSEVFSLKGEKDEHFVSENQWTTFAIGGKRGNILCSFLNDFFIEYCKSEKAFIDYYMFDCAIRIAYQNIEAVKNQIDSLPQWQGECYWVDEKLETVVSEELVREYKEKQTVFYKIAWKRFFEKTIDKSSFYYYLFGDEK